jgi:hypothetical protein
MEAVPYEVVNYIFSALVAPLARLPVLCHYDPAARLATVSVMRDVAIFRGLCRAFHRLTSSRASWIGALPLTDHHALADRLCKELTSLRRDYYKAVVLSIIAHRPFAQPRIIIQSPTRDTRPPVCDVMRVDIIVPKVSAELAAKIQSSTYTFIGLYARTALRVLSRDSPHRTQEPQMRLSNGSAGVLGKLTVVTDDDKSLTGRINAGRINAGLNGMWFYSDSADLLFGGEHNVLLWFDAPCPHASPVLALDERNTTMRFAPLPSYVPDREAGLVADICADALRNGELHQPVDTFVRRTRGLNVHFFRRGGPQGTTPVVRSAGYDAESPVAMRNVGNFLPIKVACAGDALLPGGMHVQAIKDDMSHDSVRLGQLIATVAVLASRLRVFDGDAEWRRLSRDTIDLCRTVEMNPELKPKIGTRPTQNDADQPTNSRHLEHLLRFAIEECRLRKTDMRRAGVDPAERARYAAWCDAAVRLHDLVSRKNLEAYRAT